MKAAAFDYARPKTLPEALTLLARHGPDARPIAGGQSLLPALNLRLSAPSLLIDIGRLGELQAVSRSATGFRLGALTTHAQLLADPAIADAAPLLARAAAYIAHPAIRSRGTLGGSLAHADPAAELPACMVALGARLIAHSAARGPRTIEAEHFFTGLFATALQPDELLVAVELDSAPQIAFAELARRAGDYAMIGLAAARSSPDPVSPVRLAYFSAGPTPILARAAAAALAGSITPEAVDAAAAALAHDLPPHGDLQASAETRLHLGRVLLRRVIAELAPTAAPTRTRAA